MMLLDSLLFYKVNDFAPSSILGVGNRNVTVRTNEKLIFFT